MLQKLENYSKVTFYFADGCGSYARLLASKKHIVSIQLVSKIREILGYTISIKDIFKYKTIELLFDNVIINQLNESNKKEVKSEQGILKGKFDLLPIQKWFLNSDNFQYKNYFNQSFMIKIPKLNINKLKLSIKKLIEQHDSLRLKFKKDSYNLSFGSRLWNS